MDMIWVSHAFAKTRDVHVCACARACVRVRVCVCVCVCVCTRLPASEIRIAWQEVSLAPRQL